MEVYVVEVDKKDDDNWELFGVFSSDELAKQSLKDRGIATNCSSTTVVYLDELVEYCD